MQKIIISSRESFNFKADDFHQQLIVLYSIPTKFQFRIQFRPSFSFVFSSDQVLVLYSVPTKFQFCIWFRSSLIRGLLAISVLTNFTLWIFTQSSQMNLSENLQCRIVVCSASRLSNMILLGGVVGGDMRVNQQNQQNQKNEKN